MNNHAISKGAIRTVSLALHIADEPWSISPSCLSDMSLSYTQASLTKKSCQPGLAINCRDVSLDVQECMPDSLKAGSILLPCLSELWAWSFQALAQIVQP